jgi:hypothetical protein
MPVAPAIPGTTTSGRGWRARAPAATPGTLIAGDSLPADVDSDEGPEVALEVSGPRTSEQPQAALSPAVVAYDGLLPDAERAAPRVRAGGAPDPAGIDASADADPGAPVVSAAAIGTDAITEPTPSATANAPTRPTNRPPPTADRFPTARPDINDSYK